MGVIGMPATGGVFPRLSFPPLPYLCCLLLVDVENQVLKDGLGHLALNFPAGGVIGSRSVRQWIANVNHHPSLLGHGVQSKDLTVHRDVEMARMSVPSQLLDEQFVEVESP